MSTPPSPNRNRDYLSALVVLVIAVVVFVAALVGGRSEFVVYGAIAAVLLFFSLAYLAIVVHEVGHVIGVRLGGLQLVAIDLVFFRIQRAESGPGFRVVRFMPQKPNPPAAVWWRIATASPRQVAIAVVSGPLANLLLSAVGSAIAALCRSGSRDVVYHWTDWRVLLLLFALLNLAIGLSNLVPMRLGGFPSDGMQLLDLARRRRSSIRLPPELAGTYVQAGSGPVQLPQGIRYEFASPEPVAEVEIAPPTCRPPDPSIQ